MGYPKGAKRCTAKVTKVKTYTDGEGNAYDQDLWEEKCRKMAVLGSDKCVDHDTVLATVTPGD